jgi:hypothetical protein
MTPKVVFDDLWYQDNSQIERSAIPIHLSLFPLPCTQLVAEKC